MEDDDEYTYLIKMPMDSVTEENVEKLNREHGDKMHQLETIKATTIRQMWLNELDTLTKHYLEYKEDRARLMSGSCEEKKKIVKGAPIAKKPVASKKLTIVN